jgi:hypothetical protein
MPVDVEIVAGGVWVRVAGEFEFSGAAEVCLAATQREGFIPGGRMLVDMREAIARPLTPEAMKELATNDVPRVLEVIPHWGLLTAEVDQWELGRDIVRNSRDLESVEFFSDLSAALRWLTDTE